MEPYERALQFMGRNTVQLRSSEPLPEWVARDDDLATTSHVPWVPHDPREYQFKTACQNGTNVPGYWPDEENGHGRHLHTYTCVPAHLHLCIVPVYLQACCCCPTG